MLRFNNAIIIDGEVHELVTKSDCKSLPDDNEVCNYCSLKTLCSNADFNLCGLFGAKLGELFRLKGLVLNGISILEM